MAIESKMHRPPVFGRQEEGGPAKGKPWAAVAAVLVLVALAAGAWWYVKVRPTGGGDPLGDLQGDETGGEEVLVQSGAYQAVFLDNGQVYFGELGARRGEFYRLTSVYYMKYRENPQAGAAGVASDVELVKLGAEVHAPDDYMDINKDHILFIEDLTSDSKVAKAIAENIAKTQ